ncbi:MAG: ABC transporter permease, partial [Chloroflexi bacterium]|nr:ABC transporter permease [Chloroflexota bacterium]
MLIYLAQRLVAAVPTLFGVAVIVFLMLRLLPGDPARTVAGLLASEEDVERIRRQLGLNQPLPVQFVGYFGRLLQLDLGISTRTSQPVLREVWERLPNTIELAVLATAIAVLVGVVAGVVAAAYHNTKVDFLISAATLVGVSMPV